MFGRIRRHEVFRSPAIWLAQSGVMTGALLGFVTWRRQTGGPEEEALQILLAGVWLVLSLYLLFGRVHRRCGDFDLMLPIPARKVWLSHVAAVTLSAAANLAVALGLIGAVQWALRSLPQPSLGGPVLIAMVVHVGAGLILAVVAIESIELDSCETTVGRLGLVARLVILVAVGALGVLLVAQPLPTALIPVGLALVLGARTLWRLPVAFTLVPLEARPAGGPGLGRGRGTAEEWAEAETDAGPLRLFRHFFLTVQGTKWGAVTPWIIYPLIAIMGAVAGGAFSGWPELQDLRYLYIPLYVYMLFSPVPAAVEALAYLDPLPIARRTLLALVTVPALVSFVLGYGMGHIGSVVAEKSADLIVYQEERKGTHHYLEVPIGRAEIAWDGDAPVITSPWGETHPAWEDPVWRGSRIRFYSPYHTPEGSSSEFVALQVSRAVEAVYGRSIAAGEINERYLALEEGEVVPVGEGLTLVEDYPDLEPRSRGPVLPFFLFTVGLPWILLVAFFLRSYRVGWSERWRKLIWVGAAIVAFGLVTVPFVLAVRDILEPWAVRGLIEIPLRKAGESVVGTLAVWASSLLPLVGGYRLAAVMLERAELPAKPLESGMGR
jgi:hypothetical protein